MANQVKYPVIRDRIRDVIDGLEVGDALPPERAWASELGVSRMTLRRAIDELVLDGLVVRRQGAGTFVAAPKITQPLAITSFSDDMRARGHEPSSSLLSMERIHAGPQLGRRLDVSPSDRLWRIVRLRAADGSPMALETLHVPVDLLPGLDAEDLTSGSFYELLAARDIILARALQSIEPTVTDEQESPLLEVPLHSPAFLFERMSYTAEGTAVEFVRSVYRGDRYKLTAELRGGDASQAIGPTMSTATSPPAPPVSATTTTTTTTAQPPEEGP
jgi:GntR family transcriptional regulator